MWVGLGDDGRAGRARWFGNTFTRTKNGTWCSFILFFTILTVLQFLGRKLMFFLFVFVLLLVE